MTDKICNIPGCDQTVNDPKFTVCFNHKDQSKSQRILNVCVKCKKEFFAPKLYNEYTCKYCKFPKKQENVKKILKKPTESEKEEILVLKQRIVYLESIITTILNVCDTAKNK